MRTRLKTTATAGVLALSAAAGSMSAMADPLPFLTFSQHAGWDSTTAEFEGAPNSMSGLDFSGDTSGLPNAGSYAPNTYTDMAWSSDLNDGVSSINIASHNTNNSPSGLGGQWNAGDWAIITTLTQTNEALQVSAPQSLPNPLWKADAVANLEIYDNTGTNLLYGDVATNGGFNVTSIEFWETFNAFGNSAGCNNPNPYGSACDDIYRVTALDFAPISFTDNGYKYDISFTLLPGEITGGPEGLQTLICEYNSATPQCQGLGVPEGEIWVFTPEYNPGTSTIYVAMQYAVSRIPEPSIVGLFALGLLGMGVAARRRKEEQAG